MVGEGGELIGDEHVPALQHSQTVNEVFACIIQGALVAELEGGRDKEKQTFSVRVKNLKHRAISPP